MFEMMFVIVPIFVAIMFIFTIALFISPKLRGKLMSTQIKAKKYMMEESKEDIKSISDDMAYATKDSVKVTASAIKEGWTSGSIYCKYCGTLIDGDSKFCKKCGKEQ